MRLESDCGSFAGFASAVATGEVFPFGGLECAADAADLVGGGIGPTAGGVALGFVEPGGGVADRRAGGPPTNRGFVAADGAVSDVGALTAGELTGFGGGG